MGYSSSQVPARWFFGGVVLCLGVVLAGCPEDPVSFVDSGSSPSPSPSATLTAVAHQAYLKAPNAEASDLFGRTVALDGNTLVVAAPFEDSNQTTITHGATASADNSAANAGAVYVFLGS